MLAAAAPGVPAILGPTGTPPRLVMVQERNRLRAREKAAHPVTTARIMNTTSTISVRRSRWKRRGKVRVRNCDIRLSILELKSTSLSWDARWMPDQAGGGGGTGRSSTAVFIHLLPSSISMIG